MSVGVLSVLVSNPGRSISTFCELPSSRYKGAKADCAEEPGAATRKTRPVSHFFEVHPFVSADQFETLCTVLEIDKAVRRVERSPSMTSIPAGSAVRNFS
jgi:hypothetical protein